MYVIVVVGLAIVKAVFVEVKAVFGVHVYERAPLAVKEIVFPIQIIGVAGFETIVGVATTVTVEVCV